MHLSVGFRRIIRSVLMMQRCFPAVNAALPSRYTVKSTQICSCRYLCDQKTPEAPEVVRSEEQEKDGQTNHEGVEEQTHPRTLPLPSQEFLDSLNKLQMDHYKTILDKYENKWSVYTKDLKVPTIMTDSSWKKVLSRGTGRTVDVLMWLHNNEVAKRLKKERVPKERNDNEIINQWQAPPATSVRTFKILRMYQAMEYGQELVYDLGFASTITIASHFFKEETRIRRQLEETIHSNYKRRVPFHLIFCNVDKKSRSMLEEVSTGIPITITDGSYLDKFAKKELVYLSPDSDNELITFNHKHVYIVGCITDLVTRPLTKTKAQREGIKHACFPIRRYLGNTKSSLLTLNQVSDVLCDLRDTGDWRKALKHVPGRFQKPQDSRSGMKRNQFKGKKYQF